MKPSLRKVLQIPVACVLFVAVGFLSLLLIVWMAIVSVGLLIRKGITAALGRLRGQKDAG